MVNRRQGKAESGKSECTARSHLRRKKDAGRMQEGCRMTVPLDRLLDRAATSNQSYCTRVPGTVCITRRNPPPVERLAQPHVRIPARGSEFVPTRDERAEGESAAAGSFILNLNYSARRGVGSSSLSRLPVLFFRGQSHSRITVAVAITRHSRAVVSHLTPSPRRVDITVEGREVQRGVRSTLASYWAVSLGSRLTA